MITNRTFLVGLSLVPGAYYCQDPCLVFCFGSFLVSSIPLMLNTPLTISTPLFFVFLCSLRIKDNHCNCDSVYVLRATLPGCLSVTAAPMVTLHLVMFPVSSCCARFSFQPLCLFLTFRHFQFSYCFPLEVISCSPVKSYSTVNHHV